MRKTRVMHQPALMVDCDPAQPGFVGVTVCGLDPDVLASLERYNEEDGLLPSLLRVSVAPTGTLSGDDLPDIAGRYRVSDGGLQFLPHFPFEPGLSYRAIFNPRPLGRRELSDALTLEFSLPRKSSSLRTEVRHIFPSSDRLPENLLRFYVGFSNSMQRGRAQAEIAVLGPDGKLAPDVLYRAPVELWDKSMRYLTVLLDPGRLKRGVGPHRELGPPLKAGQVYTLAVGAGMLDLSGRRLTETVYKRFRVTGPVREHIAVEHWKVLPPVRQSCEPLVLLFPRPFDWAMLPHAITIASSDGRLIDGCVVVDQCETRWSFTPISPWAAGPYRVSVASSLEDVCGNSVGASFERPLRAADDLPNESAFRSFGFHVV